MSTADNEIHHVSFTDPKDEQPTSITILIRHQADRGPITTDDVLDVHEQLQDYKGVITPFLH